MKEVNEDDHDPTALRLLQTTIMNNTTFNKDRMEFKSQDCSFFGYHLSPEGLKLDSKVKVITRMDSPKTAKELQSFFGHVPTI